jgi:hypothetical protein
MLTSKVPVVVFSVAPMAMTVVPAAVPEPTVSCTAGAVAFRAPPTATPSVTTCMDSSYKINPSTPPLGSCSRSSRDPRPFVRHGGTAIRVRSHRGSSLIALPASASDPDIHNQQEATCCTAGAAAGGGGDALLLEAAAVRAGSTVTTAAGAAAAAGLLVGFVVGVLVGCL